MSILTYYPCHSNLGDHVLSEVLVAFVCLYPTIHLLHFSLFKGCQFCAVSREVMGLPVEYFKIRAQIGKYKFAFNNPVKPDILAYVSTCAWPLAIFAQVSTLAQNAAYSGR